MTISKLTSLPGACCAVLLFLACSGRDPTQTAPGSLALDSDSPAAAVGGSTRPASVPADFVETPNGYMHPSCVFELAEGEHLLADGRLQRLSGLQALGRCGHARYDSAGSLLEQAPEGTSSSVERFSADREAASAGPGLPTINGWVQSGYVFSSTAAQFLSAKFKVPASPPTWDSSRILYYFPGLEDGNAVQTILQPVLGYNHYGAGKGWSMASWNCCFNGNAVHSTIVPVSAGDTLYGEMKGYACSSGACETWDVLTEDLTKGTRTQLTATPGYGQHMTWIFGGAQEAYGVTACSDYAATPTVSFTNMIATDTTGLPITSAFSGYLMVSDTDTPACQYAATVPNATTVSLTTRNAPCAGNAFRVQDSIAQRYYADGGPTGDLKCPTSNQTACTDGVGKFNTFTGGSIYFSPSTGAHAVHGSIKSRWAALGAYTGILMYPTSDELSCPDKLGRYNIFQGGSIYWTSATGAHYVSGLIKTLWASLGAQAGWLGYPTGDPLTTGASTRSNFQHGYILYTAATGAVAHH